jgi:hypothetical protein
MNSNRKLLRDILADSTSSLRQEALEASLLELRRKRRVTRMRRAFPLAIAAMLVLSACLFFLSGSHHGRKAARVPLPRPMQTAPALAYAPIEIVTNHWPAMAVVESRPYSGMIVDNSMVRPLEFLDDAGLLALFPDKSVGLIADARGLVQLVFFDPKDEILRY